MLRIPAERSSQQYHRLLIALGNAHYDKILLEMLFSLALFGVLWALRKRPWAAGLHFVLYLALYSLGQVVLFIWRDNVFVLGPLKQAQVTAVVVLVALVPIALWLKGRQAHAAEQGERLVQNAAESPRLEA